MIQVVFEIDSRNHLMASDYVYIHDSFDYINWLSTDGTKYDILYATLESKPEIAYRSVRDLILCESEIKLTVDDVIAVGSIEFTEKYLGKQIKPIGIPKQLRNQEALGRQVYEFDIRDSLLDALITNQKQLFIKSATVAKSDITGVYNKKQFDSLMKHMDGRVFVSEVIDIKAEWRCFIYNNQIVSIQKYIGSIDKNYDLDKIRQFVTSMATDRHPPAYTLDIGLTSDNKMVVIEVHNFLSCGLYGFESLAHLSKMTVASFKFEKNS